MNKRWKRIFFISRMSIPGGLDDPSIRSQGLRDIRRINSSRWVTLSKYRAGEMIRKRLNIDRSSIDREQKSEAFFIAELSFQEILMIVLFGHNNRDRRRINPSWWVTWLRDAPSSMRKQLLKQISDESCEKICLISSFVCHLSWTARMFSVHVENRLEEYVFLISSFFLKTQRKSNLFIGRILDFVFDGDKFRKIEEISETDFLESKFSVFIWEICRPPDRETNFSSVRPRTKNATVEAKKIIGPKGNFDFAFRPSDFSKSKSDRCSI